MSSSSNVMKVDNPYTLETYCEIELKDAKESLEAVQKSSSAQKEWSKTSLATRIEVVRKFMQVFEDQKDVIAKDISGQMGKTFAQAKGEVGGMMERCEKMIELAPEALKDEILPEKSGFFRKIGREPVGVVLVVAPWNYPLLTSVNSIVPALLSGNSVVLKHSSRTPLCADHFERAFLEAGAPPGVLTALHTGHAEVDQIIRHPEVGFVAFTGSVPGGHQIYSSVSNRFIDATLELGGKDPGYVAEDANLAAAVETLVDGAYYNCGQSCCGIERVYVHEKHYESFLEQANEIVQGYNLGDPMNSDTTMGPVAQQSSQSFLLSQIKDAKAKGARVLSGGNITTDTNGKGRFFEPSLLADCDHSMDIMMEESFGPVLGVMPVKSDEHAIQLMNDSQFGLTASIFTESQERAAEIAPRIETGTVFMNRCDYLDPELPWTGVKDTGKGVSLSRHGFKAFSRLKGYHFKLSTN